MKAPDTLFHYTTGNVFRRILHAGAIVPDKTEPENPKEIATATFSAHPEWEPTRFRVGKLPNGKLVMLNKLLLQQFDGGLIRITVPGSVTPMDWKEMKEKCGMSKQAIKGIYDFAISVGARTSHWFGTFEPVTEEQWLNVEILDANGSWREITDEEIPEPTAEPVQPQVQLFANVAVEDTSLPQTIDIQAVPQE
jgi:hypothetical protein